MFFWGGGFARGGGAEGAAQAVFLNEPEEEFSFFFNIRAREFHRFRVFIVRGPPQYKWMGVRLSTEGWGEGRGGEGRPRSGK